MLERLDGKLNVRFSIRAAAGFGGAESRADRGAFRRNKWLPLIDTDGCVGCGRCVEVCAHDCLEMIWAFATLVRPERCTSGGDCEEVCREDVIQMGWVASETIRRVGRWER